MFSQQPPSQWYEFTAWGVFIRYFQKEIYVDCPNRKVVQHGKLVAIFHNYLAGPHQSTCLVTQASWPPAPNLRPVKLPLSDGPFFTTSPRFP